MQEAEARMEWKCSCSVSLGYQIRSSLGFYFGKSLGLKSSRTKNICDVGSKNAARWPPDLRTAQPHISAIECFSIFHLLQERLKDAAWWSRQRAWSPVFYMFAMAKNAPGLEPGVPRDKSASSKFLSCVLFKKANAFWIGNTEPGRQKVWVITSMP